MYNNNIPLVSFMCQLLTYFTCNNNIPLVNTLGHFNLFVIFKRALNKLDLK